LSRYRPGLQGTLFERTFYSAALNYTMPYNIYLPPGYDATTRRYPVLYMLHGGGGHRDEWLGYELHQTADKAIRDGVIQPMIIVFPQGDGGYYANNANNGPRWGDYIWRDVPVHIDATYRTLRSARSRAIGGNSMGGWGALSNSFLHPEVYTVAGAHSPSLPQDDGFRPVLGTGEEFKSHDPVSLARSAPGPASVRIWIDTGRDDMWVPRINELHDALAGRGIAHHWEIGAGDHDYTYWMKRSIDYLTFYSSNLTGE
jgi:enterochelin esterase-like enzyme